MLRTIRLSARFHQQDVPASSILSAKSTYNNSKTQQFMRDYSTGLAYEQKVARERSQSSVDDLMKHRDRTIMFREIIFEEPRGGAYVMPERRVNNRKVLPHGVWGVETINKLYELIQAKGGMNHESVIREKVNKLTQDNQAILKAKFLKYYRNIGRPRRDVDLKDEIELLNNMSNEEYENFLKKCK